MPKREKLLAELRDEDDYGIFLAAQMGGVPNELQLIIQTARFDAEKQGLRPRSQYVIRVLGIAEHRMSLGIFGRLFFADEHPILFHHNEPRQAVHFDGKAKDVNELVLDIHQAYVTTFGPWRELATDINREKPLVDLLSSGGGLLGVMPKPAAERMVKVLQHHGLNSHMEEQETHEKEDEHGRSRLRKLLGIDDSYFVALDFTVDEMGKI
jgi:hypothetical protein